MDRKKILIADIETAEVAELRRNLVTTGYDVRLVNQSMEVLGLLDSFHPNLIICEARMPQMDGPALLQEIRNRPALQRLPFVLTGKLKALEERLALLKLALDDYWQKPIEAAEAVVRVESLIKEAELFSATPRPQWRGFSGNLSEMSLADLLHTIAVGKKTCAIKLRHEGKEGAVYITAGEVIDAELQELEARRALLRMFTWSEGSFQVELRPHERPRMLTVPTRDLISEGLTRQERWSRMLAQMPPLSSALTRRAGGDSAQCTEEERAVLALLAEAPAKPMAALIEKNESDDLRTLTVLKRLLEKGEIVAVPAPAEKKNGELFTRLQEVRQQGAHETKKIGALIDLMVTSPHVPPARLVERRRTDRRQIERRRGAAGREKARVYLNKSELLMIREKLARS